jgi:hypothetical protein
VLARQNEVAITLLEGHKIPVLLVSYSDAIGQAAKTSARVAEFLQLDLDQSVMARAIDPALYRQRRSPA